MHAEELRETLRVRPFKPFAIHLADGRVIPVAHPELAIVAPGGRTAFVFEKTRAGDVGHRIDVLLITDLADLPNGKPRRAAPRTQRAN